MTRVYLAWSIAFWLPAAAAAQEPARPPRGEARRAELEARLHTRFLERAAQELALDAGDRERLGAVLRETAEDRRDLAREALEVRRSLAEAMRDSTTSDATFRELLARLDRLRERELELWRRERSRLAEFLSPRQQAAFMGVRARFNERLMEIRARRRPAGRSPRGP